MGKWKAPRKNKRGGFFAILSNQRNYLDRLAQKRGIETQEDWYKLKYADVREDWIISKLYNGSLSKALCTAFPEFTWYPWFFSLAPKSFWNDFSNQRKYFDWLAEEPGIQRQEDWYSIQFSDLEKNGGIGLLRKTHNGSFIKTIESVYPEYEWLHWKFQTCPRRFWFKIEHQRAFFEHLATKLGLESQEDWYNVTQRQVARNGGSGLLLHHEGSLKRALRTVFPEYNWQSWRFFGVPWKFWQDEENVVNYRNWLSRRLFISNADDWKKVSYRQLTLQRGSTLASRHGGVNKLLSSWFPLLSTNNSPIKMQSHLLNVVQNIFRRS